jgi:hypothetical protein
MMCIEMCVFNSEKAAVSETLSITGTGGDTVFVEANTFEKPAVGSPLEVYTCVVLAALVKAAVNNMGYAFIDGFCQTCKQMVSVSVHSESSALGQNSPGPNIPQGE